jgi:hypothetical protein
MAYIVCERDRVGFHRIIYIEWNAAGTFGMLVALSKLLFIDLKLECIEWILSTLMSLHRKIIKNRASICVKIALFSYRL